MIHWHVAKFREVLLSKARKNKAIAIGWYVDAREATLVNSGHVRRGGGNKHKQRPVYVGHLV
jgi:hypothetical protein